jgi:hypothetical protein
VSDDSDRMWLGQRACARPDGCCATGPVDQWCSHLRESLTAFSPAAPARLPRLDAPVTTTVGPGRVVGVRVMHGMVRVALDADGTVVEAPAASVLPVEG